MKKGGVCALRRGGLREGVGLRKQPALGLREGGASVW